MLEQLFGSRTRVKLLRLFLTNPTVPFYVREISRKVDEQLNSVRRELANLTRLGVVGSIAERDKKYYQLNTSFVLAQELKAVLLKSQLLMEQDLIKRIRELGKVKYLALTGMFTGAKQAATDILVVGKVDRNLLVRVIERFQREVGKEVNYTLFSSREYNERRGLGDKFLLSILNSPQMVIIDELNEPD
ncbi:MAG TPA: winged helix-turn-helix domain-containing protein [Patescibacteria group bacterium]|nr:winged helix-turn-helix domain-containing protein [Patescibacteria group bacterium]